MRLRLLFKYSFTPLVVVIAILVGAAMTLAQTSSFTYQGRLTDGGKQPTATYDMEFRLFDASEGGNPLPLPVRSAVVEPFGRAAEQLGRDRLAIGVHRHDAAHPGPPRCRRRRSARPTIR